MMEFKRGARLVYCIGEKDSRQFMFLTYRFEGDTLLSDQPSEPREERTKYEITQDGKLILYYGNDKGVFVKVE